MIETTTSPRLTVRAIAAASLCLVSTGLVRAQSDRPPQKRTIAAVKATAPPKIDGDLSDPCWTDAPVADRFTDSQNGVLVADQTVIKMLYDDKYIYIAYDCRDSRPEAIVARETVRDAKFQNNGGNGNVSPDKEDNVEIDFDAFNSHADRDISQFSVNAIGTRSAQLSGGRGSKAEWKGDWDAAVKRSPTGWTCEIRIPWASLNYPSSSSAITMGINFYRFQDRTKTQSVWSNEGPQGFTSLEGSWNGVQVPHDGFHRTLSLLPYSLTTTTASSLDAKFGLDARYLVTPQLTAVASVNPDFSSVEGAIQTIQFSHAARSLPDLRPFFTEGGQFFSFNVQGNDIGAFLYPNTIHTFDVGTKLYGKFAPNDSIGFLNAMTVHQRNDMATRYAHSFSATSLAGIDVVQDSTPAGTSTVTETDEHFRWGKLGFEDEIANSNGPGAGGGAELFSTYYQDKALFSEIQFSGISNKFNTPIGFFPFTGYKGPVAILDWSSQWRHGPFRSFDWTDVALDWFTPGGQTYFKSLQTQFTVDTRTDWRLAGGYQRNIFGSSNDSFWTLSAMSGASNRFKQFGLQAQIGEQGNDRATFLGPSLSVRTFKKLDLVYGGSILNRAGVLQQHILTFNYEFSPIRSLGGRLVVQNGETNVYFFYHKSGGTGTDFFVVLGDPNAPKFVRQLQVKWVFSFATS